MKYSSEFAGVKIKIPPELADNDRQSMNEIVQELHQNIRTESSLTEIKPGVYIRETEISEKPFSMNKKCNSESTFWKMVSEEKTFIHGGGQVQNIKIPQNLPQLFPPINSFFC